VFDYFQINRLHLLRHLMRAIDNSDELHEYFSKSDLVTYNYFVGRKAIFDNDLTYCKLFLLLFVALIVHVPAEKSLEFAFKNCPSEFIKNKRLVLIYLIPVKMLLGFMPKQNLLDVYDLGCFHELVLAVK
jgi:nuclear mRNA export protein PCID2/THP1